MDLQSCLPLAWLLTSLFWTLTLAPASYHWALLKSLATPRLCDNPDPGLSARAGLGADHLAVGSVPTWRLLLKTVSALLRPLMGPGLCAITGPHRAVLGHRLSTRAPNLRPTPQS